MYFDMRVTHTTRTALEGLAAGSVTTGSRTWNGSAGDVTVESMSRIR